MRRLYAAFNPTVNATFMARDAGSIHNSFMGTTRDRAIDRLLAEAAEKNISDADLARLLGHASQARLYNWKERDIPRAERLEVARRMELNPIWLDKGTGPKKLLHLAETPAVYDAGNPVSEDKYVFVNKVRGPIFQSGHGGISWEHEEVDRSHAFQRDFIEENGWDIARLKIFKNHGSSNAPWIMDGDAVMVHLGDNKIVESDDPTKNVFALQYGEHSRFKRIVPQHDGSVLLRSFNPDKQAYPDERVAGDELDSLAIIGRVVWRGG
jgi:phage repressor protein C with HTH and peptisase S24 domain